MLNNIFLSRILRQKINAQDYQIVKLFLFITYLLPYKVVCCIFVTQGWNLTKFENSDCFLLIIMTFISLICLLMESSNIIWLISLTLCDWFWSWLTVWLISLTLCDCFGSEISMARTWFSNHTNCALYMIESAK